MNGLLMVLLTTLFVGLKLTHVVAWSWVWVLSPLWGGLAVTLVVILVMTVGVTGLWLLKGRN